MPAGGKCTPGYDLRRIKDQVVGAIFAIEILQGQCACGHPARRSRFAPDAP